MSPEHFLLIDIDGLRPDVFSAALRAGRLPNLARLLGGDELRRGLLVPALAPAPSITFVSQASLFTGAHPAQHGILGNQFFDRFGLHSNGRPAHYAFDVGDALEVDDAVRVFTDGLASRCLQAPTLYERWRRPDRRSVVIGNMYARGADLWRPPSLLSIARLTKGGNLFGMDAADFDRRALDQALKVLAETGLPQVLTVYFMGVDHESHHGGPQTQLDFLTQVVDGYVGELWDAILSLVQDGADLPFCAVFSDHGQIDVPETDQHALRVGSRFDREVGALFDDLGLDVYDLPGEEPGTDAVFSSNGGLAHVYLRQRKGAWSDPPLWERDVLPVARAFWEAHATGRHAADLEGALAGVLVRFVEQEGWQAPYRALTPAGELVSLETWFAAQPPGLYADPVHRLQNLVHPMCGDLLLISNLPVGFYFATAVSGVHGGLHPDDSASTLAFGWPSAGQADWEAAEASIAAAIQARCAAEGGRQPSTADLLTGLQELL